MTWSSVNLPELLSATTTLVDPDLSATTTLVDPDQKTGVESFIPLHPVAEQILDLYNTEDDTKPVFPMPNRDMIWYAIHEIGVLAGVKGSLSYHQSRHTFGTLMMSAGIPIESISKMMGHTNIRTTQTYAKVTDDKISEDMDRLMQVRKANGLTKNDDR